MVSWRQAGIVFIAALIAVVAGLGIYLSLIGGAGDSMPVTQLPPREASPPGVGSSSPIALSQLRPQSPPAAVVPQPIPETFGRWQVHCVLDLRSREDCRAEQIVIGPDGQAQIGVVIRSHPAPGPAKLSVIPPWGILISAGVAGQVDSLPAFDMPIAFCLAAGCQADLVLSEALLQSLQTGADLHLLMIAADGGILRATVPLAGFAQAHRRMTERQDR